VRPLVILVVAPALALGIVAGAVGVVGPLPEPKQRATSLIWADRVFTSREELAAWLESKGASYELWAQRHAAAARTFEPELGERGLADSRENATASTSRPTWGLIAILAGVSLCGVLLLFRARERGRPVLPRRRRRLPPRDGAHKPDRGLSDVVRAILAARPHHPHTPNLGAWRQRQQELLLQAASGARSVGRGAAAIVNPEALRRHVPTRPRSGADGQRAWRQRQQELVHAASSGARSLGAAARFNRLRLRRHLPTIAFYVIAGLLSLILGASITIYAQ
jgi:hypothetical protein